MHFYKCSRCQRESSHTHLNEICWQCVGAEAIIECQSSAERWSGDAQLCSTGHHMPPRVLAVPDGIHEEWIQKEAAQIWVLVKGCLNVAQESTAHRMTEESALYSTLVPIFKWLASKGAATLFDSFPQNAKKGCRNNALLRKTRASRFGPLQSGGLVASPQILSYFFSYVSEYHSSREIYAASVQLAP